MNIEKEREEFEVWARKHGQPVFRDDEEPECYAYSNVQDNWAGWQARAALQPQGEAVAWLWDAWQERASMQSQSTEDSARLDWIEKNARRDPDMGGNHTWWPTSFNKTIRGPNLRDAIDSARRVEGGGE